MYTWVVVLSALFATSFWIVQVKAAACAEICYTTQLTGFAPGGVPGCTCSGSAAGARTGAGGCSCGQCYEKAQGRIVGFALNDDGFCTYGTDCGNCELSSSSTNAPTSTTPTSSTPTPTTTNSPPTSTTTTPVPVVVTSEPPSSLVVETSIGASASASSSTATSSSAATDLSAASDDTNSDSTDKTGELAGNGPSSNLKEKSLSLWQIVLAICCSALIFIVAVVSVCACYCKTRSRLNQHEQEQVNYYNQHAQQQTYAYQTWNPNEMKANIV